jgi:nucleotide-binding universal stress UspA family protein
MPQKILVPVEGSQSSLKAAEFALELASLGGSQVVALYVIQLPQYINEGTLRHLRTELTAGAENVLKQIKKMAGHSKIKLKGEILETTGSIATAICNYCDRNGADLIIIGTRTNTSPVTRLMLGSTALGVANNANSPVLVVRLDYS